MVCTSLNRAQYGWVQKKAAPKPGRVSLPDARKPPANMHGRSGVQSQRTFVPKLTLLLLEPFLGLERLERFNL